MRILVTGHSGYIGMVMVPMLISEGHEVIGLDSNLFEQCAFGDSIGELPHISIQKDIRDIQACDVDGCDAVIHLSGLSNDPLGNLNPAVSYEINHVALVHLAKVAKEVGVPRFLFSSSCSTYGAAGEDVVNETAAFHPVTPYGHSKVLVEQ